MRSAADLLGIQSNSAALFYRKLREVIVYYLEQEALKILGGAIELDESYFGGVRKGKRGRGAAGMVAVFGILKRGGKVYTKVVINTKAETLTQQRALPNYLHLSVGLISLPIHSSCIVDNAVLF